MSDIDEQTTTVIRRAGELSIRNASDLLAEIEAAVGNSAQVVVDFDAITGADITILQILISAHRTAADRQVALSVRVPQDGALALALARSGILDAHDARMRWHGGTWTGFDLTDGEKAA